MNINELKEKIKETNKLVSERAKTALDKAFEDIFDKYPEVVGFKWRQYTPTFNDGDPCVFRLSEPDYILYTKEFADKVPAEALASKAVFIYNVSEVDEDDEDNSVLEESELEAGQVRCVSFYRDYKGDLNAAQKEIEALFQGDVEDIFEYAYGDGYTIIATKEGLTVEDYEDY
jgi:hypothetical protein